MKTLVEFVDRQLQNALIKSLSSGKPPNIIIDICKMKELVTTCYQLLQNVLIKRTFVYRYLMQMLIQRV